MLPLFVAEPFLRFGNFNRGTIQRIKEKEVQVNKRSAEHETDKNQECTTLFISLLHSTLAGHTVHVHVSPISGPFDFPCRNTFYFIPQQIGRYNTIWSSRPTIFVVPDYCLLLLPVAEPPNDWFSIERPAIKGSIWIDRTLPPPPKNKKVSTKKLKSYCCGIIAFSMRWRAFKIGLEFMAESGLCIVCGKLWTIRIDSKLQKLNNINGAKKSKEKSKFVSKVLEKINWGSINWSIDLARGHYRSSLWYEFDDPGCCWWCCCFTTEIKWKRDFRGEEK